MHVILFCWLCIAVCGFHTLEYIRTYMHFCEVKGHTMSTPANCWSLRIVLFALVMTSIARNVRNGDLFTHNLIVGGTVGHNGNYCSTCNNCSSVPPKSVTTLRA